MPQRLNMPVSDEANELLTNDPFALLIGMVLDQQVPLEKAFSSPLELKHRLGGDLSITNIAGTEQGELEAIFAKPPALHRFPASNAQRVQKLAHILLDQYDGDASAMWSAAKTGHELLTNINALPGFGERKTKIFMALLGKQMDVQPRGWRQACAPFGDDGATMSIADIEDDQSLQAVRSWKRSMKAAATVAAPTGKRQRT